MPLFKELIGKVAKNVQREHHHQKITKRPKSNKSKKSQNNKGMSEALGIQRLNSLTDGRVAGEVATVVEEE